MKNIFVFLLIIVVASSLNDKTYLTGFANQLGLSEDQITDNINCLSNAVSTIQNFKTTVTTSGLSISDTDILNWVQQIKLVLMEDCAVFEDDVKTYFSQNSLSPVFQEAICKNIITYNSKIKQGLVTWASTLNSNQDLQAGKSQAYIYQILFGVVNPTTDPTASFTFTVSGMSVSFTGAASSDPDGTITNYKWNFGDSASSSNTASGSSAVSSHTYSSAAIYTVTLIVTDNSGNTATTTGSVRINAKPTPSFTYSVSGKTIAFDASGSRDSDGTVTNYAWTFGESSSGSNSASGATSSASHTYAATGIYSVVLTVTDNDGATTSLTKSVRINTPPTASFTASVSGKTVTVDGSSSTDIDGGIMNYAWSFGESSSSSNTVSGYINSATHTYASYGTYTVVLKVTDSDGAIGTLSKTVKVNSPPTASFTYTVSGNTISFNAGASTDSDGSITTYAWNFGESSSGTNTVSSSASTASHTYASPGTYTVTLTLTDNDGATTVLSKPAKINIPPVASFTQTSYGLTISFSGTGSTDSDGTIANYAWNFGESSSSSNTVSGSSSAVNHVYASYGTYTVSLKVTDNDGATNTVTKSVKVNAPPSASFTASVNKRVVTFNAGASTDSDGTVSSYAWNFGEPSSASNTASGSTATATHTYATAGGTFVVTLTVTDNNGGTGSITKSVTVTPNSAPTASFTYTVSGNTIYFNAGTSTDSDGSIATYAWNFGDPSSSSNTASSSSSTTSHTYTSTGTYMVILTVTDNEGTATTLSKAARINTPPTAIFSSVASGNFVSFDASGSVDPDGTIATYAWNFGESSSSSNTASGSSSSATHTYATYGTFTVTLYATDNDGATTTYSKSVRINTPPVASFSTSVTNRAVLVNAGSSYDPDGSLTNRVWDFGEPSSSSNTATGPTSTTHTYASTGGTFTITLTVTDNDGATTTTTRTVAVAANVAPTASFSTVASTSGNQITFTSTGSDPDGSIASYAWNFGDPTSSSNTASSSSSSSAIHVYAESGTYSVTLTVTDNEGATRSVTTAVTVTTICDNKLHVIASWDHEGDYDLILALPDGKYIGYWNQGPNSGTDYGKLIQDSHTMTVPEEQCWQNPNVPPSGTYLICVNPYSTSGGLPSIVTATVIINGVSTVFTKTEYFVDQDHSCSTTANSYVGSFTYP